MVREGMLNNVPFSCPRVQAFTTIYNMACNSKLDDSVINDYLSNIKQTIFCIEENTDENFIM